MSDQTEHGTEAGEVQPLAIATTDIQPCADIEPCDPEFIDGSYEGCGICPDCLEAEDQAIESDVEIGLISDDEAREMHAATYQARTLAGLHDDDQEEHDAEVQPAAGPAVPEAPAAGTTDSDAAAGPAVPEAVAPQGPQFQEERGRAGVRQYERDFLMGVTQDAGEEGAR